MKTKADLLKTMGTLNACTEATKWVQAAPQKDFASVWNTCKRGDWMLWLAVRTLDRRLVVRAACLVAATNAAAYAAAHAKPLIRSADLVRSVIAAEAFERIAVPDAN